MTSTPGSGPSDSTEATRRLPPDTRPEMLRLLVHEFLKHPVRNEAAEARFVTLATRLIAAVDVPVAAKHVRELAPHPAVPRALALYMATAPLSLAGPFLRLSPVLGEDDLAMLAETAAPSHLAAIAARRDVSPSLAKRLAALVHRRREAGWVEEAPTVGTEAERVTGEPEDDAGDAPTLAGFPEALESALSLSMAEQDRAGQNVSENVEADDNDLPAIATEREMTAPASEPEPELLAPASVEVAPAPVVAEVALPESDLPESPLPDAAEPVMAEPAPEEAPAAPALAASAEFFAAGPEERAALIARLVTLPPLPLAERPAVPPPGFIDALLDAARNTGTGALAALLARALGVSEDNAGRIVADETGQSMAVAARALGLSFAILSRVLFRLHPVAGRSTEDMARLAEMFDSLPLASAQHLVAAWRGMRKAARERAEEAPSMRSFAQPHAVPQAGAKAGEASSRKS
ncbi:DUF2336 domain-containing protein [Starkeya koreensis]|uniref:DUF2336 domain-containing protein n=1 Tax=Ancylobacter koreensis TaxID=266121 RepID=A0ABT0DP38_9HYPH|nr:DUF2336 domain-containing protein [Ancylobacter koreensis]MCK0209048.1 DUF2336 domain-containing protein [Ancylobacter koreensis]